MRFVVAQKENARTVCEAKLKSLLWIKLNSIIYLFIYQNARSYGPSK